jgi:hypothetical protein
MPKELVPGGWVKKPCTFLVPPDSSNAAVCGECEGRFGWWRNSKRHCMFCGDLFHKQGCTRKVQVEGEFFRQRICSRCDYYRSTAQHKLQDGEACKHVSMQHDCSMHDHDVHDTFAPPNLPREGSIWKDAPIGDPPTNSLASVTVSCWFSDS